ncbi:MAG: hypothetical protein IAE79_10990 [Anaerolinea sp.]|nr:hypothetical protein [Anaerolinea sp.]
MIVVSNTTPLIGLAVVGQFDLLRYLFGQITIPEAVFAEAVLFGREEGGAKQEVTQADWVKVVAVHDQLANEIDRYLYRVTIGEFSYGRSPSISSSFL